MPKVRKIIIDGIPQNINVSKEELVNADNFSDFSTTKFQSKDKAPTARSLYILKNYVDAAVIPEGALSFDFTPTIGSNNPVTSEGIYRFVLQAIEEYFNSRFVVLTQEEYDNLEVYDPRKFYMIVDEENVEPE